MLHHSPQAEIEEERYYYQKRKEKSNNTKMILRSGKKLKLRIWQQKHSDTMWRALQLKDGTQKWTKKSLLMIGRPSGNWGNTSAKRWENYPELLIGAERELLISLE